MKALKFIFLDNNDWNGGHGDLPNLGSTSVW